MAFVAVCIAYCSDPDSTQAHFEQLTRRREQRRKTSRAQVCAIGDGARKTQYC